MQNSTIVQSNAKGQVVIPQKIRKALGITAQTHLNLLQRGRGVYLYPVIEALSAAPEESGYLAALKKTKGAWREPRGNPRVARRKIELAASRKRKRAW